MKHLYFSFLLLFYFNYSTGQNRKFEFITSRKDTIIREVRLYGGLVHQHQDFFNKAFSFQGIEAGVILNHRILLGVYGSTFATALKIRLANDITFIHIKQGGILIGTIKNDYKVIHTGWLLNVGYFLLNGNNSDFSFLNFNHSVIKLEGLILTPQVYAELNIARWMKFRTGIGYSFYSFENQVQITHSDLQNISLNFGFVFGRFN